MARFRCFIPNALTSVGIGFAALSVQASIDGHYRSAAWWVLLCVLTDKADGFAARALRSSSAFGAQLDSFADFFAFGIAPATLFYSFFGTEPSAGWSDGPHRAMLAALSFFFVLCVAGRLARFNITSGVPGAERFFFGVPTTFAGGILAAFFAVLLKYGDPAWTATDPSADHILLLGHRRLDAQMQVFPLLLLPGGLAMISTFRMPKLGRTRWPVIDAAQAVAVALGYASGLSHFFPEYLLTGAVVYFVASVAFHFASTATQGYVQLPPLFADVEDRDRERRAEHSPDEVVEAAGSEQA